MNLIETDDKIIKHVEVNDKLPIYLYMYGAAQMTEDAINNLVQDWYKGETMDNFFVTEVQVQGEKESYTLKVDKFGTRYIFCTNGTMLKIDNKSDINLIVYNMLLPYLKNE